MKARVRILIYGRVQGVGFRNYVRKTASRLGVNGWVRNLSDGRVEAVLEGEPTAVNEVVERCSRGPFLARVERVEVKSEPYIGEFDTFTER